MGSTDLLGSVGRLASLVGSAVLRSEGVAALVLDARGVVLGASGTASRVLDPSGAGLAGRAITTHVASADRERLSEAIGAGATESGPFLIRSSDEADVAGALIVSAIRLDPSDPGAGTLLIGREATAEIEREARVRRAERYEIVGQLTGGVVHDLNNKLSTVTTYADLMLAKAQPGSQTAADLIEVKDAALEAATITRKMSLFSGRHSGEPVAIDVPEVVRGVEKLVRRFMPSGVSVRVETDDATPAVWGDPADLEAILIGLAANARDALQDGGTFELVVARGHREGGPSAVVEIRDTGQVQSLPPTARAVEPFFSTKPLGVGTGLGLASAQTLVSSLGGHFELEARSGGGTVARIELPGVRGDTTVEERSAPLSGSFGRPPMRALLWEPHGGLRSGLRRTLEEEGFRVTLAGDPGFSGVTAEPAPGVVVSDVPDVHGSEHRILTRVAAGFPGVPVILLGLRPSLPPPADLGVRVAYLAKPFSRARLADALGALASPGNPKALASRGEGPP